MFLDAACAAGPLPLNGDGLQSRDFTFVDTVTWVLADAAVAASPLTVRSTAFSANVSLRDLIAELEDLLGNRCRSSNAQPGRRCRANQSDPSLLRGLFPDASQRSRFEPAWKAR